MKTPAIVAIGLLAVALIGGFFAWGLYVMRDSGSWTGGSWVLTALIAGGVVATGALGGGLMWLAFYSARKGYDDDQGGFDPAEKP
jgi:hypothetical protein